MIAGARGEEELLGWIGRYREEFKPSIWAESPYVVVAATVAVADSKEAARRLLLPEAWSGAWSRTRGFFDASLSGQIYGTADEVESTLRGLVARTGADELLITTNGYDRAELLESYRRLAELAG